MARGAVVFACLLIAFTTSSCWDEQKNLPVAASQPSLPRSTYDYSNPDDPDNAITTLGRVLFYEKGLSGTNQVSCGSCHIQSFSFADNQSLSIGVSNQRTLRNTLPIQNLLPSSFLTPVDSGTHPGTQPETGYGSAGSNGSVGGLFWDGREGILERMVMMPIQNPIEMGQGVDISKLWKLAYYKDLSQAAFGHTTLSEDDVSKALAFFVSSLKTGHTRYDRYVFALANGQPTGNILTQQEIDGMKLFEGTYNCNNCHQVSEIAREVPRFANIGLANYRDKGLSLVTANLGDDGKFKVPSLRNVEFTAPYMHDGSLPTLEDVIEHYSTQIVDNPNLHSDLKDEKTGRARKMNISPDEAKVLIAFLKTLSDRSVMDDPKFSNPFNQGSK